MSLAILLHVLSAVVWVGGMFFAYVALRPAASALDPAMRQRLWADVLGRFFVWVWLAIGLLLGSGLWMMFAVYGFAEAGRHVHLMMGLGVLMMLLFLHVFFAPYRRLRAAVAAGDLAAGARSLNQIRWLVAANLTLGLIVVALASGGRYLKILA